jgi:hypothetical protein
MEQCKIKFDDQTHIIGTQPQICQECIDYLNWTRLMLMPRTDMPIAANQTAAGNYVRKFVHQMDLQEVFYFQKRLEEMAASASLIYNEKLRENKISNPRTLEQKADDWAKAQKEMREKDRPKAEKKQLNAFEKAVQQLVAVGVEESSATEIVKERFAKQGKVTQ